MFDWRGRTTVRPLFLLLATCCFAQDTLKIASPDGRIQVELSILIDSRDTFDRLSYQVTYQGKPLLATSYMGLWMRYQEPILGENLGLMTSKAESTAGYNGVVAQYMQNGSLGKRINVEFRAFNDGVAFRYIIPRSSALDSFLIESDESEFRFAQDVALPEHAPVPFTMEQKGVGWVSIREVAVPGSAPISLRRVDSRTMGIRFDLPKDFPAVETQAPSTGAWRVILVAPSAADLSRSQVVSALK
jgi:alpha-glucosidase